MRGVDSLGVAVCVCDIGTIYWYSLGYPAMCWWKRSVTCMNRLRLFRLG